MAFQIELTESEMWKGRALRAERANDAACVALVASLKMLREVLKPSADDATIRRGKEMVAQAEADALIEADQ